jgi:hypothetical protein
MTAARTLDLHQVSVDALARLYRSVDELRLQIIRSRELLIKTRDTVAAERPSLWRDPPASAPDAQP